MNISQIFAPLISMLWWVIPVLLILGAIKVFKPFLKGKIGEFAVAAHVKLYLKGDYILLNDLTLPDIESGTTQIDHILLSPYGIFVIETKNYKGWIFGTERQKQWTQKIYKQSFKFQNPIHQNYKHMKVLEKILADILDKEFIHTVIVFMPEAVFKTDMPSNVFRWSRLDRLCKNLQTIRNFTYEIKACPTQIRKRNFGKVLEN